MDKKSLFSLMTDFYQSMRLHVCVMDEEMSNIEEIDLGLRQRMAEQFDYQGLARQIRKNLEPGSLCLMEDEFSMSYSVFCFPDALAEALEYRYFLAGPMLFQLPDYGKLKKRLLQNGILPEYHRDFMEFFNHIPVFPSPDFWNQLHSFYLDRLCDAAPHLKSLTGDDANVSFFPPMVPGTALPFQPDVALTTLAERYKLENELMAAVAAADTKKAVGYCCDFQQFRLFPRSPSPLRDRKNLLIIFNTLLRKAAEAGGVHPLHIDSLSHQLAIQIEAACTMEQLQSMNAIMVRKYCLLVKNYSRRPYSALVSTCMNTIDFYYSSDISLASLSVLCSVSKSHLAAAFKKETGMTVTDYINQTRIKQSLIFLNTSSMSVSEIATRCGFSDANYFSRTFRRLQGQTPSQYRKSLIHTD